MLTPDERTDLVRGLDDLAYMVRLWSDSLDFYFSDDEKVMRLLEASVPSLVDSIADPRSQQAAPSTIVHVDGKVDGDALYQAVLRARRAYAGRL